MAGLNWNAQRRTLGTDPTERAWLAAQAREGIAAVGRAQRAVRLLEAVTAAPRCPAIRAPRHLGAELIALGRDIGSAA